MSSARLLRRWMGGCALLVSFAGAVGAVGGTRSLAAEIPVPEKIKLTPEQLAAAESFMALKEVPVTVDEKEVTSTGRTLSGTVGDEFDLKLSEIAGCDGSKECDQYKIEAFSPVGKSLDLPFIVREPLERVGAASFRTRIALIAEAQSHPLTLVIRNVQGNPVARISDPLLNIASPFAKAGASSPPQKNPPIGALSLPFPWWAAVLVFLLLLSVFSGIAFFVHRWAKNRTTVAPEALVVPERPEDVAALDALAAIERQEWMKKSQFKPHFFGVSETLKRYLGRRFGVNALESTSGELLELLRAHATLSDRELLNVNRLFDRLDWVKFTDAIPDAQEGAEVIASARQLILQTRRRASPGASV